MDANNWSTWAHCNNCLKQMKDDPSMKFHVTSCGHLFCQHCLNKNARKCLICDAICEALPIGASLPQNIKHMFQEPYKMLESVYKAIEFQEFHVNQTLNIFREKEEKMTKKLEKLNDGIENLKEENRNISDENDELENKIQKVHDLIKQKQRAVPSNDQASTSRGTLYHINSFDELEKEILKVHDSMQQKGNTARSHDQASSRRGASYQKNSLDDCTESTFTQKRPQTPYQHGNFSCN